MRLPDKWYQKYEKDKAFHKAAYNRNKVNKTLTKYSRLFLCAVGAVMLFALLIIGGNI